jgi:hypothetical protein
MDDQHITDLVRGGVDTHMDWHVEAALHARIRHAKPQAQEMVESSHDEGPNDPSPDNS